jgi:hypothetical protein
MASSVAEVLQKIVDNIKSGNRSTMASGLRDVLNTIANSYVNINNNTIVEPSIETYAPSSFINGILTIPVTTIEDVTVISNGTIISTAYITFDNQDAPQFMYVDLTVEPTDNVVIIRNTNFSEATSYAPSSFVGSSIEIPVTKFRSVMVVYNNTVVSTAYITFNDPITPTIMTIDILQIPTSNVLIKILK